MAEPEDQSAPMDEDTVLTAALIMCVLSVLVSAGNILLHLANYNRPALQKPITRIVFVVPCYAIGSYLSLQFRDSALYFETVRDVWEAYVIYCFLQLMLEYAGGDASCVAAMADLGHINHPWPLCRLQPITLDMSGEFLRYCKQGTLQFVALKPLMAVISLLFLARGAYHSSEYQAVLLIVYNVSYTVALYALLLFYIATRDQLKRFNPLRKFLAVKAVVFLTYWQGLFVQFLPGLSAQESQTANDLILSAEMLVFAGLHLFAFSHKEFEGLGADASDAEGGGGGRGGSGGGGGGKVGAVSTVLRNARDVISVSDVLSDAVNNFRPATQTYVLSKHHEHSPAADFADEDEDEDEAEEEERKSGPGSDGMGSGGPGDGAGSEGGRSGDDFDADAAASGTPLPSGSGTPGAGVFATPDLDVSGAASGEGGVHHAAATAAAAAAASARKSLAFDGATGAASTPVKGSDALRAAARRASGAAASPDGSEEIEVRLVGAGGETAEDAWGSVHDTADTAGTADAVGAAGAAPPATRRVPSGRK